MMLAGYLLIHEGAIFADAWPRPDHMRNANPKPRRYNASYFNVICTVVTTCITYSPIQETRSRLP